MLNCPAHLPAALGTPAPTGLGHVVEALLIAATPEFLGALAAALVIAAATATGRYLHRHRSTTHETDSTE